jgi:transposase
MTASSRAAAPSRRALRRLLGRVEHALRPGGDPCRPEHHGDDEVDHTTTRELLVPSADEPAATRASRQARDYLEHRRRKLIRQLDDR